MPSRPTSDGFRLPRARGMGGSMWSWMLVVVAGCLFPPVARDVEEGEIRHPSIREFRLWCDYDKATWEIRIETDAWTGGAVTHWTSDGVYVEKKNVDSVAIAEDGSSDLLEGSFSIADDWREVSGKKTAFHCSEDPNILVLVSDLAGDVADCRVLGPEPGVFGVIGLRDCEDEAVREDRL